MAEEKQTTMAGDLKGWGIGLLIMGVLHFVIPLLDPIWGMALIPIGILALTIHHRGMYIVIGSSLVAVGVLNIVGSLQTGTGFWPVFGCMQIYWGFKEMVKFGTYGKQAAEAPLALEGESAEEETPQEAEAA